ncbi:radical SAM protein [Parabacteroides sp. PF5-9]|uniref:B12-binding domain-containing radical SAM protein n=1 Tax=Parabacteroides sp. PF5-9 TaxID=1742404 RepID=UPI00247495DF|nr:radical SAM protein [Parabacteroides sp. PF5-9]MDH6359076.1 anaerobic magnesium-protoporphyrin IX monomethyl ester cyclase [Parabacteroides sp. PF5-9]
MKTVLTTLNAKYIHTSLALRWLYVANKESFDLTIQEYTIKESIEKIADNILASDCTVLGISVSIWNVNPTSELVAILKNRKPELIILLGGPEVSHEPAFFLENWPVDYIISGEGEFVLGELLQAIQDHSSPLIEGVSFAGHISKTIAQADLNRLASLPSPYMLDMDKEEVQHKLVYFETSRGCPYQCQYCLSSLEKGVRYFPQDYIFKNLDYLIQNNAHQIKFLDRTFNLNKTHTKAIFDYLIQHYRSNLSCQFEIYADLLSDEIIDYLNNDLPKNYFRFEIGIQSTYEPTNRAVNRKQDFPLLSKNVKKIMEGEKIDLHLDLIAGLPYETFDRFRKSFNDVFELKAKEVQLGFLKMLRGTNLRRNAKQYGYYYKETAPYEIICNADLSADDLTRIHDAEHALEKFWNSGRFSLTMDTLLTKYYPGKYFELFDEIGQFYKTNAYPHHGYQLEDLFRYFNHFLQTKGINLFETLRTDYYSHFSRRPQGFWEEQIDKKRKKQLLYQIAQDKEFLIRHGLNRKIIEKQTAIDPLSNGHYLLTIFLQNKNISLIYNVCSK